MKDEVDRVNHITPEKSNDKRSKEMEDKLQAKDQDLSSKISRKN